MPGRNVVKQYSAEQYYHVYSRGVAKQLIFKDAQDYGYFLNLFKRYLSLKPTAHKLHYDYPCYHARIELVAFCLMPNHIHMLIFQHDEQAMADLMRSLLTSYSVYFNKKYGRVGPVFQSRYKASLILERSYLEHVTRYIHLNPSDWRGYTYSSLPYYKQERHAQWLNPTSILTMFTDISDYLKFLEDYESQKYMLEKTKQTLANY